MLLQVMETRAAKVQASVLRQVSPRATDQLLEAKLMVASGHIPVVTAMDDYEDEPIPAEWCADRRQYGYNNSIGRWVAVDVEEIAALTVNYQSIFNKMLFDFDRIASERLISLIDSVAWDIGTIQLKGAKSPVPVWFARRLSDPAVWRKVGALLERRPPGEVRVILTSTPGDRLPVAASKKDIIISVTDVAKAPGKLAISPQAVGARGPSRARRSIGSRSIILKIAGSFGTGVKLSRFAGTSSVGSWKFCFRPIGQSHKFCVLPLFWKRLAMVVRLTP